MLIKSSVINYLQARNFLRMKTILTKSKLDPIDCVVCIDIECTCDSPKQIHPLEVIEIACLKLDLTSKTERNPTFHSYVRPIVNPSLTIFCQDLTGILQSTVENAQRMDKVSIGLINWMKDNKLIDDKLEKTSNFAFASCGNFDLRILSPALDYYLFGPKRQYQDLELPVYFKQWINVKKTFVNHKGEWPKNLYNMMELLGEEPSGRLHSAKDDCENLARIVSKLDQDGCKFFLNNTLVVNE